MRIGKLSSRTWWSLIVFAFFGQVAWMVENMYFNIFIFQEFNAAPRDIALMVSLSAVTAAVTTLLMGALSDKIGKRKIFIAVGYMFWGISIISFALLRRDILSNLFPYVNAAALGVALVILFDCIMTFFGSTANDAAFNAWLTDITTGENRGKAEGVNAAMPLVALLAVFGGCMGLTARKQWGLVFIIIGTAVFLVGILAFFLLEEPKLERKKESYFKNIIYGFRPKVIKENKTLYIILLGLAVLGIAVQVFIPYLIIYYQYRLGIENYVFIFAPAILIAGVASLLYGRLFDKYRFKKMIIPAVIVFMAGLLMLYFFESEILVFVGTLLLLVGNLSAATAFGANVRDYTPKDQVGLFQGLRIVASVLVPMAIGPWIGSAVINSEESFFGEDGVLQIIPTKEIFLAGFGVLLLLLLVLLFIFRAMQPRTEKLDTEYQKKLNRCAPWPEYPRPQLKRDSYFNLNGLWQYRITKSPELQGDYQGEILVPFPLESSLSGVTRIRLPGEYLFYRREFVLPKDFRRDRILFHAGAIDQEATLYINGYLVTTSKNGYLPFSADITDYLLAGNNEIIIRVKDDLEDEYPHGKQSKKRGGIWYTPISGIWQTVWLESVNDGYIEALKITPDFDNNLVKIDIKSATDKKILIVYDGEEIIGREEFSGPTVIFRLDNPKPWTPATPYLYDFTIIAGRDQVSSYFAIRKFSIDHYRGYPCFFLNNQPYFHNGVLDQGYYSDGLYLPATLDAYRDDIALMKRLGFNTLRKHIKIEPLLWYHLCDKMGMIVWQDMVNNSRYMFLRDSVLPFIGIKNINDKKRKISPEAKRIFEDAMAQTVCHLYNVPAIALWTIFNEGWGQFESNRLYERLKSLDPTRYIDATSGWFHQEKSDVESMHIYFRKIKLTKSDKPLILSEFGGYSYKITGHAYNRDKTFGYRIYRNKEEYQAGVIKLFEEQIIPKLEHGLTAAIYTQLSDVEDEVNGFLTYDRKLCKVDIDTFNKMNDKVRFKP
ncbi:MAG: MFS transporter [Bacilli bacterium]|nr:MFS transporter [Bacilli bacterium]